MKHAIALIIALTFLLIPIDSFALDSKLPLKTIDQGLSTVDPLLSVYETGDKKFDEYILDNKIVFHHQRKVGDAIVEKDFIVYQFDRQTNALVNQLSHWRDDIPEKLPVNLISQFEAELMISGEVLFSQLLYLSPESNIFPVNPTPKNPCWTVWHRNQGKLEISIIDALEVKYLGQGIAPPNSANTAFSTSGPRYFEPCEYIWNDWRDNATSWFNTMGYNTLSTYWPTKSTIEDQIQSYEMALFYQIAHGSSTLIQPGCYNGNTPTYLTPYNIYDYYTSEYEDFPNIPFTFIASCGGMCETDANTFSDAFRRGSLERTTTVGYCGMDTSSCATCWSQSVSWQEKLFSYINQGFSVKTAFDKANADYPSCGSNSCMRFVGDESLTLVPPITRCEKNTPSCSGVQTLLSRQGTLWDDLSIENHPCDEGCCDGDNYCVFNGLCYYGGSTDWDFTVHDIEYRTNKKIACDTQGAGENAAWMNLDYAWHACERDGGFKWRVGNGDAEIEADYNPGGNGSDSYYCKWNLQNPIGSGNPSTECCCGDDYGEFHMISPSDGSEACCNTENECVIDGVCQNHPISTEICGDLIDNDCDGLLDCLDPDCDNMPFYESYVDLETHTVPADDSGEYFVIHQYYTGELIKPNIAFEFKGTFYYYVQVETYHDNNWYYLYKKWIGDLPEENGWYKVQIATSATISRVRVLVRTQSDTDWQIKNFRAVARDSEPCGNGDCEAVTVCDYTPGQDRTKCGSSGNQVAPCTFCNDYGQETVTPEVCWDGIDNDCDGLIDCQDGDCFNAIPENCGDGIDNDCDGAVDCADSSCDGYNFGGSCGGDHPGCSGQWVCDVGVGIPGAVCNTHGTNIDPDPKDNDPAIDECWTCNLNGDPTYFCGGIN